MDYCFRESMIAFATHPNLQPHLRQAKAINKVVLGRRSHPLVTNPPMDALKDHMANPKAAWYILKEMDKWATTPITQLTIRATRSSPSATSVLDLMSEGQSSGDSLGLSSAHMLHSNG